MASAGSDHRGGAGDRGCGLLGPTSNTTRYRTKQLRVNERLAAQLAAQKQATEQAQKLAAEEKQRRAIEERNKLEQERTQLEKERKRIEAEKQAAEEARKQAEASQRAASTAAKDSPKFAASHDGSYSGQLCNQFPNKEPVCWPVVLVVRNGIAEGSWISPSKNSSRALGTIAGDGSVQLNLSGWTRSGTPTEARLLGRIVDGAITVSGQWINGNEIVGDWKRKP